MHSPTINIVWFKRDLRLSDHGPLCAAIESDLPTLLVFCMEPVLMAADDAAPRHWRFAWQSAADIAKRLEVNGHQLHIIHQDALVAFQHLCRHFTIQTLYSHQETGNKLSFERDRAIHKWCESQGIDWIEFSQDGVIRGRKHRRGWAKKIERFLEAPLLTPDISRLKDIALPTALNEAFRRSALSAPLTTTNDNFQPGGERNARLYWQSFLEGRGADYGRFLSKPHLSRRSCSRLSPYLTWGNISAREIWQYCRQHESTSYPMGRTLRNLRERIWWRSHYLQKLEAEWEMEYEPINRGFKTLGRVYDQKLFDAWSTGQTGYPMVDASMRCLQQTGWLNFRMRAMLTTFATFTLWLPWRPVALHLAKLFLDYEPGIHYPQIQMQAGLTGYHTLRIYNPDVQAERHDQKGVFIHRWIPELRGVPAPQCHQPWKLTLMEQQLYDCQAGEDYPLPIVDFQPATSRGRDHYWEVRQSEDVQQRTEAVWNRHCLPRNIEQYRRLSLSDENKTQESPEIH